MDQELGCVNLTKQGQADGQQNQNVSNSQQRLKQSSFFLASCVTRLCHRKQLKTPQNSSTSYECNKNLQNPHNKSGRIEHVNSETKSSFTA